MRLPIAPLEIVGAAFRFSYEEFHRIISFQILLSVFFYAGMLPSARSWIYAFSVLLIQGRAPAEPLVRALQWGLQESTQCQFAAWPAWLRRSAFLVVEIVTFASKIF